jgi:hypothetical protein
MEAVAIELSDWYQHLAAQAPAASKAALYSRALNFDSLVKSAVSRFESIHPKL